MSCEIREDAFEASLEASPRRVEEYFPVCLTSVTFRVEDSGHTWSFHESVCILVKTKDIGVEYGKRILNSRAVFQSFVKDIKARQAICNLGICIDDRFESLDIVRCELDSELAKMILGSRRHYWLPVVRA